MLETGALEKPVGRGQSTPAKKRSPSALVSKIRPTASRLGWGVIDQGVSSLTNFAVVLTVARVLGAEQLGAFSLAYVTYGFALNVSRSLATDPLIVRFSNANQAAWRRATASCTGTAIVTGLVCGSLTVGAGFFLSGTSREAFFGLGLMLPALLLQDSWRFAFFALGEGKRALINDTVWGIALIPALLVVIRTGHKNVFWLLIAWGAGAAVAAAVGPWQARVMPRVSDTWHWLSQHRDLGPRYIVENASGNVSSQGTTYGLSVILGLSTVGYLQAESTLLGPCTVILFGVSLAVVAEASRILHRSPHRFVIFCISISIGMSLVCLCYGLAIEIALPLGVGHLVLPAIWRPTYPLILPATFVLLGSSAAAGAGAGLHALGAAKRSMAVGLITSIAYLVSSITGGLVDGAIGTLFFSAVVSWGNAVFIWLQFRAALRESRASRAQNILRGRHRRLATADQRRQRSLRQTSTAAYPARHRVPPAQ